MTQLSFDHRQPARGDVLTEQMKNPAWDAIQERARQDIKKAFKDVRCLAACAPTGFGKTRLGANLIHDAVAKGNSWLWYTHRRTLTAQTIQSFKDQGLDFGVRASGMGELMNVTKPGQIAMLQSERAAIKARKRGLHKAKFVILDEAHANATGFAEKVIKQHIDDGAYVLLLTATPVNLGNIADKLIVLATLAELRSVGALVPAICYAPSEVDMKDVRKVASGDFSPTQQAPRFMRQQVVGNIITHFFNLNPEGKPSLGFAPCVKSSMWFVDQFKAAGISAAHIDGQDVYLGEHDLNGEPIVYRSSQKMRQQVFAMLRSGEVKIIWSRFCLREGVDLPEIAHLVMATAFGTPESWIQACGRGLRAHPSLSSVTCQDHGGNLHRPGLGSPNMDRDWTLETTNKSMIAESKKEQQQTDEPASVSCPSCCLEISRIKWRDAGSECPECGYSFSKTFRMVFQTSGKLQKVPDKKPGKKSKLPEDLQKAWIQCLNSFASSGKRYNQMSAYFQSQTGIYPNKTSVTPQAEWSQREMLVCDLWPEYDRREANKKRRAS